MNNLTATVFRLCFGALLLFAGEAANGASEMAVAIRYLQPAGTSHAQIYLYREDGKLLRQLTHNDSGQMKQPVFSADGGTIVFTQELPDGREYTWSVEPKGENLRKLDTAPGWYTGAKGAPYFTDEQPTNGSVVAPGAGPAAANLFKTPDGSQEIVLKVEGKDDDYDTPGHGAHYELIDLNKGKTIELGKLPGFVGLYYLMHLNTDEAPNFLMDPPLRMAFFDLHLDSTDKDTVFALDLNNPRLVQLSPNWATPVPLPGEGAFLTSTQALYLPIPNSSMTANCCYIDRWDGGLNRVRYARDTAAVCYGGSMYRPGMTPAVINVLEGE